MNEESEVRQEGLTGFAALGLSSRVLKAIEEMGFEEPSPIQERTIPAALQGRDVIGRAQTGTGKTAAFGIPIVERLDRTIGVQALVITPTRELALQVSEEIARIGKFRGVKTLPVYGGQPYERQIRALRMGVPIVIGTPGRLLDHLGRGTLDLSKIRTLVLDEADEMLDMGFIDDIEKIFASAPQERQTMLFSATFPSEIERLSRRYLRDPARIAIAPEQVTVPQTEQAFYEVRGHDRIEALSRVLDMESVERGIIFCRTKKEVDELSEALRARGYMAAGIHGDLTQRERERVLGRFRQGEIELLVATDVAARGLDIEHVSHVINFEIPQDAEAYVHRIGRTGRAGRSGVAITLIEPKEFRQLRDLERGIGQRIQRRELPSLEDLWDKRRERVKTELRGVLRSGRSLTELRELVRELLEDEAEFDSLDVAAAALQLHVAGAEVVPVEEDFGDTGAEPGMVRLFVNVGRAQGILPADVVRAVANLSGIAGNVIGLIDIYDRFTFVEVPKAEASRVMHALQSGQIKGRSVNVEPARRRN
ncbi:MAG: DEAD/DEAH box helicase [Thermaerobacter sp.]|nr:DEAD/DEAH box helicase [Thermaerobacter sp.]